MELGEACRAEEEEGAHEDPALALQTLTSGGALPSVSSDTTIQESQKHAVPAHGPKRVKTLGCLGTLVHLRALGHLPCSAGLAHSLPTGPTQDHLHRCQVVFWSGVGTRPGCPQRQPLKRRGWKGMALFKAHTPMGHTLGFTTTLRGYTDTSAMAGCAPAQQPWFLVEGRVQVEQVWSDSGICSKCLTGRPGGRWLLDKLS